MRILKFIALTSAFLLTSLTSAVAQVAATTDIVYGKERKLEIGGISVEGVENYDDDILIGLS